MGISYVWSVNYLQYKIFLTKKPTQLVGLRIKNSLMSYFLLAS
jgi:hypothetical protein